MGSGGVWGQPMEKKKDTSDQTYQRSRSTRDLKPVGKLIEFLRLERGMTLTEFARKAGLSHAVLSGISYGSKNLTEKVLKKLEMNLQLPVSDLDRLKELANSGAAREVTDRILVPAARLYTLEDRKNLDQVLIIDPAPLEESDPQLRDFVVRNLRGGCQYTYFTPTGQKAETLEQILLHEVEANGQSAGEVRLEFVVIPSPLHHYFYFPTRALYHLNTNEVDGSWAFRGRRSQFIELGMLMETQTARELWLEYGRILTRLRRSGTGQVEFADELLRFHFFNRRHRGALAAERRL
jgi:transcriptional regulator with XRE-family HTH domain